MSVTLRDLAVAKDTAQWCVSDIQEYANANNDGNQRGYIILESASQCVRIPMCLKNEMLENLYLDLFNQYYMLCIIIATSLEFMLSHFALLDHGKLVLDTKFFHKEWAF